jgi:hypothetical protein
LLRERTKAGLDAARRPKLTPQQQLEIRRRESVLEGFLMRFAPILVFILGAFMKALSLEPQDMSGPRDHVSSQVNSGEENAF